jgi:hypothetical protein
MKTLLSLLKFSTSFYNIVETEENCLLGYEAVESDVSMPLFRRQVLQLASGMKTKQSTQEAEFSTACLLRVFVTCFSPLKVEAVCSAESSLYFYQATRHHIRVDRILHAHNGEKFNPASLDRIYIFGHLSVSNAANSRYGRYDRLTVPPNETTAQ